MALFTLRKLYRAVGKSPLVKEAQVAGLTRAEIKELDEVCRSGAPVTVIAMSYLWGKISAAEEEIRELERVQAYLKNTLEKML